ncbi:MAG TPA: helicase-related protein [Xanthobacteraceae bacterium]|nr:helicase-related protein [Xanthobacteraceae bacterium]
MPISFSPATDRDARARGAGVTAVLGPTNTGKTHLAIERMLAHSSGVIGLPLRLLAREVYSRCVERVGADAVALITGEEKIKPPNPRFWVATVEAMPRDLDVAFLAVDEIQLAADFDRGHVFTDRMLHRRGREETLVLGAATMRPIVERILPGVSIVSRPRLSQLTFAGEKKLTRLPRRSAVVAFSAEEVYAIAELIRRQRGGAAVVLGGLSPRTRNAQVALYQAGDVDFLVATDAIGMGLNLDVDHIAFAADRKFDGYQFRKLGPAELAQIAGRAGRASRDGTFGTTGRCPPFETELVQALETHTFEPVKIVQWRNTDLDFSSIGALQATLAAAPTENTLTRAPVAEDILVLDHASRDDDVRGMTRSRADVERLWDVCQVPDYRKIAPATHAELVVTLYGHLIRDGAIPTDWFAAQVAQADLTDGDIDTLSNRIAHIRTWTFVANRPDWLADPEHWQNVTRGIEDKLSDALHERLTERFIDRRTSVLMRRLRENAQLEPEMSKTGEVVVEGHTIGRLDGFMFVPDTSSGGSEAKTLQNAAQKVLAGEIAKRATRLSEAPDDQFVLAADGTLRWTGAAVGKLVAGEEVLRPRVRIIADEHLSGAPREAVDTRLDRWLKSHIEKLLGPLFALSGAADITGIARGVAFQLVEALGVLERQRVAEEVKGLEQPERASLRKYGVRFGAYHIHLPLLLKPAPRALAAQLWALAHDGPQTKGLDDLLHLAGSGRTSIPVDKEIDAALYRAAGYRVCGERAVRVDILERLADLIRPALAWREGAPGQKPPGAVSGGGFTIVNTMTSLTGASGEDFASILRSLGYRLERRPKPAEPVEPAPVEAVAPQAEIASSADETAPAVEAHEEIVADADVADPATEASLAPPEAEHAADEAQSAPEVATELAPTEVPAETPAMPAITAEDAASATGSASTVVDSVLTPAEPAAAGAAEPEMIEVWRPGRAEGRARPNRKHRERGRHFGRRDGAESTAPAPTPEGVAAAPAGGDGAPAEQGADQAARTDAGQPERQSRHRRRGGEQRFGGEQQFDRPRRDRDRPPPNAARHERQDRRPERREKAPDPNSPFAKLAALKAQLEADAKERR